MNALREASTCAGRKCVSDLRNEAFLIRPKQCSAVCDSIAIVLIGFATRCGDVVMDQQRHGEVKTITKKGGEGKGRESGKRKMGGFEGCHFAPGNRQTTTTKRFRGMKEASRPGRVVQL